MANIHGQISKDPFEKFLGIEIEPVEDGHARFSPADIILLRFSSQCWYFIKKNRPV